MGFFWRGGTSAEGEVNVAAGTPVSQSKEVPFLPIGLGPRESCQLRSMGGQGPEMPKLGLYLQGLEEVQGIRTAARDEAEGGIGQCCLRVGPKEAQEVSITHKARDSCPFPPLAPLMASQLHTNTPKFTRYKPSIVFFFF